jgi:hypothetical protein
MIPAHIPRRSVKSENLKQVGYDPQTGDMVIEFHAGPMYVYKNVPAQIHTDLMASEKKGEFFHRAIRNRFVAFQVPKV